VLIRLLLLRSNRLLGPRAGNFIFWNIAWRGALKTILSFRITHAADEWIPPVIKTTASKNEGIGDVLREIEADSRAAGRTTFLH